MYGEVNINSEFRIRWLMDFIRLRLQQRGDAFKRMFSAYKKYFTE